MSTQPFITRNDFKLNQVLNPSSPLLEETLMDLSPKSNTIH